MRPPSLVAGRRVVVHLHLVAGGVVLPPLDHADELLADVAAGGAAGEQVLGAVDLRRLRQDGRAAVAHELVHRRAQRRVGGDAGIAVGAAALQGEHELGRRHGFALHRVDLVQHALDALDAGLHRLAGAAGLLDRHGAEGVVLLDAVGFLPARDLEALAAQAHHHDAADVRVGGVAPLRALEDLVALALARRWRSRRPG